MLFSLVFNDKDSLPQVRALESTDARAAIALLRALRPQPPSDLWAIRVRVSGGASAAVTLERSIYCPPLAQDYHGPQSMLVDVQPRELNAAVSGNTTLTFEATISEAGQVIALRVLRSTGIRDLDDQMIQEVHRRQFEPAKLDGVPVQALYRSDGQSPRL